MKVIFTQAVLKKLDRKMETDIKMSVVGTPEMKKQILKVLQQANRRAQNIEKSGVVSPAYQALVLEGRKGYSKFAISGLDIKNEADWDWVKYEYAKAIEYLNNPTSSSTGAKQYVKHIANKYKVDIVTASNVIRQATDTQFHDSKIPLLNYRTMIDTFIRDSRTELQNMEQSAEERARQMEKEVSETVQEIYNEMQEFTDDFNATFRRAFKLK